MTARYHRILWAMTMGALISTLFGCGGPFLQGKLTDCPVPYRSDIDSLEITLIPEGGEEVRRRFPVEVSKGGKKITFKYDKRKLEEAFDNIRLDETTGKLRIVYEKYLDRVLLVCRDIAGLQVISTTPMRNSYRKLDCRSFEKQFPELKEQKGIYIFEKYDKISTVEHKLRLPGASRAERRISLTVSVDAGMTVDLDCDLYENNHEKPEDWER